MNNDKKGSVQEFFRFYRGYAEASRQMKPKPRGELLCAVIDYMFYGEEPSFKSGSTAAAVWGLLKKNLDKSIQYAQNGRGNRNQRESEQVDAPSVDDISKHIRAKGFGDYATEKANQFINFWTNEIDESKKHREDWRKLCDDWLSTNRSSIENNNDDLPPC